MEDGLGRTGVGDNIPALKGALDVGRNGEDARVLTHGCRPELLARRECLVVVFTIGCEGERPLGEMAELCAFLWVGREKVSGVCGGGWLETYDDGGRGEVEGEFARHCKRKMLVGCLR